ncbi:MAG: vWA domain-containing protein [bacterium]
MFYRFADPMVLLFLLIIPLLVTFFWYRKERRQASITFSQLELIRKTEVRSARWSRYLMLGLRMLAVAGAILALARPQSGLRGEEIKTEGIDIMLALDVSSSMLAEDIEPNRVEAAKAVAATFVQGRRNDRIGLIVFSGKAYTQCPLTLDYGVLLDLFQEMKVGMIEDGTAVGMGLGVAVNRLRDSDATSKVIILLTDGRNNRGEIEPKTAAKLASSYGIRIYTIGAGKHGTARYPVDDPFLGRRYVQMKVDVDEEMLQEVAKLTDGMYFRATDRESLESIYREIDELEKTEIEVTEFTRYSELFHFPLGFAIAMLFCEVLLANTRFRKLP